MHTRVYVDNVDTTMTETELANIFSAYGNIAAVNIAVDRTSQNPRGFGFVTMVTPEGARAAIQALNGKTSGTGALVVSEAEPAERRVVSPNGQRGPRRRASLLY